jgi:two-component system CheB/CheR fusion protein
LASVFTIVKQLVALHGGSVTARSEGQDKGSEFTVRLPDVAAEIVGSQVRSRSGNRSSRK